MTTQKQAIKSIKTVLSNEGFPLRGYKHAEYYLKVYFHSVFDAIAVEVVDKVYRSQEQQIVTHELVYVTLCKAGFNVRPVHVGTVEITGLFAVDKPY